jgi:lysophospholipase L1-like esterase
MTRLAPLGDSIADGIGAARTADTLGSRLAAAFGAEARVFAVPGARSADLAGQLPGALAWQPDVAVVVIGANDLIRLVPPDRAAADLRAAVRALRAADVAVVVAPAPDLSVVPHVPAAMRTVVKAGSALLRSAQTRVVLAEGGRVVGQVRFSGDPSLFAGDRFHPSSKGYALIADALLPEVSAALQEPERRVV